MYTLSYNHYRPKINVNHYLSPVVAMNIQVSVISATSVKVSWDSIEMLKSTEYRLYGYKVYYNQKRSIKKQQLEGSVTIPSYENNALIEDLISNRVYQFQVETIFEVDREVVMGMRSPTVEAYLSTSELLLLSG